MALQQGTWDLLGLLSEKNLVLLICLFHGKAFEVIQNAFRFY